jgi:hypothetical protein
VKTFMQDGVAMKLSLMSKCLKKQSLISKYKKKPA